MPEGGAGSASDPKRSRLRKTPVTSQQNVVEGEESAGGKAEEWEEE